MPATTDRQAIANLSNPLGVQGIEPPPSAGFSNVTRDDVRRGLLDGARQAMIDLFGGHSTRCWTPPTRTMMGRRIEPLKRLGTAHRLARAS